METLFLMIVFFLLIHWLASRVLRSEGNSERTGR